MTALRETTAVHSLMWKTQKPVSCSHTYEVVLPELSKMLLTVKKMATLTLQGEQQWLHVAVGTATPVP